MLILQRRKRLIRASDNKRSGCQTSVAALLSFSLLVLSLATGRAEAEEACSTVTGGQFFNAIHCCATSVLSPQGGRTYGPGNLARWNGNAGRAWCKGVPGHGIGETIMIQIEGAVAFRRLLIANGYSRSPQTFANNGRVKTLEISGDTGFVTTVDLPDRGDIVPVDLAEMAPRWIRLHINDVYPGARFSDTSLSFVMPDYEHEEALLQQK